MLILLQKLLNRQVDQSIGDELWNVIMLCGGRSVFQIFEPSF